MSDDPAEAVFTGLLAAKKAMDDGLDCEFHVKVSGPNSIKKAQAEISRLQAEVEKLSRWVEDEHTAKHKAFDEADQARAELTRLREDLAATHGGEPADLLASLDEARADLAAAQKREEARKAWRDQLGRTDWVRSVALEALDAIGRGEGPK